MDTIETVMATLLEIKADLATKSTSIELQGPVSKLAEKEERIVALESSVFINDEGRNGKM